MNGARGALPAAAIKATDSSRVIQRTRPSGSASLRPATGFGSIHSSSTLAYPIAAESSAKSRLIVVSLTPCARLTSTNPRTSAGPSSCMILPLK